MKEHDPETRHDDSVGVFGEGEVGRIREHEIEIRLRAVALPRDIQDDARDVESGDRAMQSYLLRQGRARHAPATSDIEDAFTGMSRGRRK
jgi:hypothetical protein